MKEPGQEGFVLWFTGLPSAGKTTLAQALGQELTAQGVPVQLLDSDALRRQLTPQPTYSPSERDWFYDTITFLAELFAGQGINVLIAATAPRRAYRDAARSRLSRFAEVFVDCAATVCHQRDPKGLWRRAASGEISALPGAGALFEPPPAPEITLNTEQLTVDTAVTQILDQLKAWGWLTG